MDTNKPTELVLKSINQLLDYSFFIPAYQRGYRWTETQVIQLLKDVWDFAKNPPQKNSEQPKPFYCLQPVVVKKRKENEWEVIDGQQRLTTLYLILKNLQNQIERDQKNFSRIFYETRSDSEDFLKNIENHEESKAKQNIDYFHIYKAYQAIYSWFREKANTSEDAAPRAVFAPVLLRDTKVIWYEVDKTEYNNNNSIDIFTRLNIGKIPLTNAELIKALFLQKKNFSEEQASLKQIQIAAEWDNIEKKLQDDAFWFFLYNPDNPLKYENRIEYVFDLMKKRNKDSEYYHTFNGFNKDFQQNSNNHEPDIDTIWDGIKEYFLTFEEWFKDDELFHYIGYLIDCIEKSKNKNRYIENIINRINEFKEKSQTITKKDFKIYLQNEIKKQLINHNQLDIDIDNIEEFEYGDKRIKRILLLFNILTILQTQKSDMRFPFNRYKSENWDIEHVCSQTDKEITKNKRIDCINDILEYFAGTTDIRQVVSYIESLDKKNQDIYSICRTLINLKKAENIKDNDFNNIFGQVQKYFKEDPETEQKDDISNLALLDATTNRSYGNSFFPIKRKRIIENDSKGIFVPIATKNLFLKYYSSKLGEVMHWSNNDAQDYLEAIKTMLKNFFNKSDIYHG
jgi:hypothetical protein